jgi:DNA-directed RNA polymerase I, II, and III subunit RPABC2
MSDPEFDDDDDLKLDDDPITPNFEAVEGDKIFELEDDSDDDMDYERTSGDDDDEIEIKEPELGEEGNDNSIENLGIIQDDEDIEDNEDDDDDEDLDESLKKLEKDVDNDIILRHHPEIIQNNYDEILALCKIIRNDKGIIVDELHKTYPFITKYEYARVIGMRAKQLNNGADPFVKVDRGMIDGYTIALKEMEEKKIPFIIARPLPNGGREYWKLQDLELIHF